MLVAQVYLFLYLSYFVHTSLSEARNSSENLKKEIYIPQERKILDHDGVCYHFDVV